MERGIAHSDDQKGWDEAATRIGDKNDVVYTMHKPAVPIHLGKVESKASPRLPQGDLVIIFATQKLSKELHRRIYCLRIIREHKEEMENVPP